MTIPARARRVALAAVLPVALRLALLPLLPPPKPEVHDEFSYLLAGDTFAHGRLANPSPPLPVFFESFHVIVEPVYASMYLPAPGAFLAIGEAVFGAPWAGVILSVALMCGAVALALEALLPPRWARAGALSFALLFGVESYWMNSFWGGAVPALGGALVLAGAARLVRIRARVRWPLLEGARLGAGAGILLLSRPFEGFWIVAGVALATGWAWSRSPEVGGRAPRLASLAAAALALAPFAGFLLVYDRAVLGDPATPPSVAALRRSYVAPLFSWERERPVAGPYSDPVLARFYLDWRRSESSVRLSGDARDPVRILWAWFRGFKFFGGAALAAAVLALFARGRTSRFLLGTFGVLCIGLAVERVQQLHYLAPAAALLVAVTVQGLRALPAGPHARRIRGALPAVLVAAASVGLARNVVLTARLLRAERTYADRRAELVSRLLAEDGRHLVFVRYGPDHDVSDEWVYNGADLPGAKVLFVRDRGAEDARLAAAFPGRRAWRLFADERDRLEPLRP